MASPTWSKLEYDGVITAADGSVKWFEIRREFKTQDRWETLVLSEDRTPPDCWVKLSSTLYSVVSFRTIKCEFQLRDLNERGKVERNFGTLVAGIGVAGLFAAATVLTGGLAAGVAVAGAGLLIGGAKIGNDGVEKMNGPRWGKGGTLPCLPPSAWSVQSRSTILGPVVRNVKINCTRPITGLSSWHPQDPLDDGEIPTPPSFSEETLQPEEN
ncbi:hypothetical protein [Ruegeria sp. HKCCD6119]|uniref:hypothetical protein n=1 Tax=Ruegeria sp. HKCCD6119 TaxID=2683003 RepID=UPI00149090C0|nr:hypothetical protein [Ruegeria sp. HKCCD6119]NOD83748.1 hypothetical protein [Ruegeria sp. HKCCD6119]